MKVTFWKFLAWISIACSFLTYLIGWYALFTKTAVWGIATEFFFYDSIVAVMFGVFFLIYAAHYGKKP